jgi:hypothetical protein
LPEEALHENGRLARDGIGMFTRNLYVGKG